MAPSVPWSAKKIFRAEPGRVIIDGIVAPLDTPLAAAVERAVMTRHMSYLNNLVS